MIPFLNILLKSFVHFGGIQIIENYRNNYISCTPFCRQDDTLTNVDTVENNDKTTEVKTRLLNCDKELEKTTYLNDETAISLQYVQYLVIDLSFIAKMFLP